MAFKNMFGIGGFSTILVPYLLCLASLHPAAGHAETVRVATASNFISPMREIADQFEKNTGHTIKLSFGSSGKLYSQIQRGAPFDVFFSADQATIDKLAADNRIVPKSRFTYAEGKLVLIGHHLPATQSPLDFLRSGKPNRLALANPRFAPYGVAAVETLNSLALENSTAEKWVMGESVGQTMQFIHSGNVQLGFVALSQVITHTNADITDITRCFAVRSAAEPSITSSRGCVFQISKPSGQVWVLPQDLYRPISQDAALLTTGAANKAAQSFLRFFRSPEARRVVERHGYGLAAN